ncbi:hypothetical protein [Deferribacter autotrophicus]|uniref:hypothetical protein n=1 Tax=Deferribacter autotrophicus TaxID=500465 RepID=UPI00165E9072|nr:hypothetical protein [Deferribacter autotrophicus]
MKCKKCGIDYLVFKAIIDRNKKMLSLLYICPECMAVKSVDVPMIEHFDFREDYEPKKHKDNIINFNNYFNHR